MPTIREAAEKLQERSDRTEELSEELKEIDIQKGKVIKEGFLSKKVESQEPGKVAGVDGGVQQQSYSAGDIAVIRAVATVFDFNGELNVEYLPEKKPEPEFFVFDSEDADSMGRNVESKRVELELERGREALEKADRVFMDGSIVPSYSESENVINNLSSIVDAAEYGQLVGVVEDSYGLKLSSILKERTNIEIGKIRDTRLMDSILEPGERSFVRKYSSSPVEHPVLQEIDDREANLFFTFYLKISEDDLPLRIDYFGKPEDADKIAGELISLASSESYTVPSPVLEADRCAKISVNYIEKLESRFLPDQKRRNLRPF